MDKKTDRIQNLVKRAKKQYAKDYLIIAVPGFISKKFIGYCAMKEDLELILQYMDEIRDNPTSLIRSALSYSIIALYGKCFTDASKSSFPRLEPSKLFAEGEENLITHNYLMQLRHQFIAHRGETENEVSISYLLYPKYGSIEQTRVHFSQLKMSGFSKDEIDKFEILVKYLINWLVEKIQKSGEKVQAGMLNNFTAKELSLMQVNNVK